MGVGNYSSSRERDCKSSDPNFKTPNKMSHIPFEDLPSRNKRGRLSQLLSLKAYMPSQSRSGRDYLLDLSTKNSSERISSRERATPGSSHCNVYET